MAMIEDPQLEAQLDLFLKNCAGEDVDKQSKILKYCTYVSAINTRLKKQDESVNGWIREVLEREYNPKEYYDPISELMEKLKLLLDNSELGELTTGTKNSYVCGFKQFVEFIVGIFYANTWLTLVKENDRQFCKMIAENAIFAERRVFNDVVEGKLGTNKSKKAAKRKRKEEDPQYNNPYGSWDYMEHFRDNQTMTNRELRPEIEEKRKADNDKFKEDFPDAWKVNNDPKPDNNTYANKYIKNAILESYKACDNETKRVKNLFLASCITKMFKDYEVCHIWDFPDDRRYYASVANLVLVPRALAQLTDHNNAVKDLLRYRAYCLFEFWPSQDKPKKPDYYDDCVWREIKI